MTKTNTHKLNDRWRTIMRELKAKEIIEEFEVCVPSTCLLISAERAFLPLLRGVAEGS